MNNDTHFIDTNKQNDVKMFNKSKKNDEKSYIQNNEQFYMHVTT